MASECYRENLRRLREIAARHGLRLNSDAARVEKVAGLMAENYRRIEEWVCPCKQTAKPAAKGVDKTCPCPEWKEELREDGHCSCRLFYTMEEAAAD